MNKDLLFLVEELRKIRNEEEVRFDKKLFDAIGAWKFKNVSCFVAVFTLILAFAFAIPSIIRNIVHDKVRIEFEAYTNKKINEEIIKLSDNLGERLQRADNQLRFIELYSKCVSGSASAYEVLKYESLHDETALTLLNAVESHYVSSMFRRGDNYCMNELAWGYKKLSVTNDELVQSVAQADKVTPNVVNSLINLAQRERPLQYISLFIEAASRCDDLNCRKDIVDCLSALSHDCPRTLDVSKIEAWWKQKAVPDRNLP